ncbi:MAG: TonB family protein [Terriglobales bacterium]
MVAAAGSASAQQPPEPVPVASTDPPPQLRDSSCLASPSYPEILRQAGIEGQVVLAFVIDSGGTVESSSVRVVSSAHQLFEGPARAILVSCQYQPGRVAGRAVRVRTQRTITFVLPKGSSH